MTNRKEALLWNIALPGFGQFLNGKLIKGIVLVFLEFLINAKSYFNEVIISSFQMDIEKAILQVDYQWLMFYPCLYFFAMWDAWKDAEGGKGKYSFLPFVFAAYSVTRKRIYRFLTSIVFLSGTSIIYYSFFYFSRKISLSKGEEID